MIDLHRHPEANDALRDGYRDMLDYQATDISKHLTPAMPQMPLVPQMPAVGGSGTVLPATVQPDSWKNMLAHNIGKEVVVSSLIGSQNTVVVRGTLHEVGNDYIVLYHPGRRSLISTDIYAIRYLEFLPDGQQRTMEMDGWQDSMQ